MEIKAFFFNLMLQFARFVTYFFNFLAKKRYPSFYLPANHEFFTHWGVGINETDCDRRVNLFETTG